MNVAFDADAIRAISPAALSAYARLNGWKKTEALAATRTSMWAQTCRR